MDAKPKSPSYSTVILREGLLLALIGWAGVAALVYFLVPFLFPRWLFFFSLDIALTGTALPLVWYLNRRFSPNRFPHDSVLWREGMEAAGLVTLLVWLQAGRILNAALGWIFFLVFLAVEILLRVYENSRWLPSGEEARSVSNSPLIPGASTGLESDRTS
jgi:hypothetical protein